MEVVAERYQAQLPRIKENVRKSHDYFKHNYDRFNEFRRFVFESSLKEDEVTLLMTLSKPQLEFNILEAYVSRLLGEFSKQEPDISVSADDENQADPQTIKLLEAHLRHVFCDAKNHHTRYEVYKDLLSGGFSVLKVLTEYANNMSFNQVINIERTFDPTLCGFDQLSRYSHKGDGRFCFELRPIAKEVFMEEYPDVSVERLTFRRDFSGFNWSYLNDATPILLMADYYEKKKKKMRIVQLRDGKVMTQSQYDKMLKEWTDISQPPVPIGKPRTTTIDTVVRYRMIENQVLEYEETDFTHFPLVFVDGSSILVKTPKNGNIRQVTRPYVYHAQGAQRMKNFSGIALANEIENIVQHKFIIKKEALPKEAELMQAIKDIQKPSNIIVNAYYEENPDQPIPDPIVPIVKMPAPPEVLQSFTTTDGLIQQILGSYDASLGINNNQLSGIAIVEGATQSNAAAMPYIVGMMQGLQRCAEIYVDLFPKYYKTPRTIPVMNEEGLKSYQKINQQGQDMFFDSNALNVIVKAGASFSVQKSRTLMMVKEMSGMSPLFAQFMAEKGLSFILDNMEGRGIEQLKALVEQWTKEYEQQKQQAQQNNPEMMKAQMMQQKMQQDMQLKNKELEIRANDAQLRHDATLSNSMASQVRAGADIAIKEMEVLNKHAMQRIDMAHKHAGAIAKHHLEKREGLNNAKDTEAAKDYLERY